MSFENILQPLGSMDEYRNLVNSFKVGSEVVEAHGLLDVQKAMLVAGISRETNRTCLLIAENDILARKFYEDISFFDPEAAILLPSSEMIFHRIDARSNSVRADRIKVLNRSCSRLVICASLEGILSKFNKVDYFFSKLKSVSVGDLMPIEAIKEYFIETGYERVDMIEGKGQFSIRGGIIDFFLATEECPIRMELFGDEIDSIRYFDLDSQRSLEKLKSIKLTPMREVLFSKEDFARGVEDLKKSLEKAKLSPDEFIYDIERMEENIYFEGIESYLPFMLEKDYCLFDYLKDAIIIFDEPNRVRERYNNIELEFFDQFKALLEDNKVLPEQINAQFSYNDILFRASAHQILCFNTLLKTMKDFKPKKIFSFITKSMQAFHGKVSLLADEIRILKNRKYKILVLAGGEGRGKRLAKELWDFGLEALYQDKLDFKIEYGQIIVVPGHISGGFEFPTIKYALITDVELLGARRKRIIKKKSGKAKFFGDLKSGDYIVHEHHGIGQYMGIEHLKVNDIAGDYLQIRYHGNDKLYIPTNQFDLIQKYVGGERAPRVNRLSSAEWAKTKAKAKNAIMDLALELLKLYAERNKSKGHSFSPDTSWQEEFEVLFPYEETPGQIVSIEEIKQDMESDKVMDRLLCGDVGYGKTEVALRAAFKTIMDGKQVAILVPTTILAQQHYNTCIQRFENFPIEIGLLSRFKNNKEQKKIIEDLKRGTIDLIIGTHRLVQGDVSFKELGLLIVDEEQRFGVRHKERIKRMKKNVDVLTLTATPIPRTLHMSLIGVRDISVIEEPPDERYPVLTYVMEYNDEIIKDAIAKEMNRGGQVYFLYNRVRTIERIRKKLKEAMPGARIAIAHGQMEERILENTMFDFFNGAYDVLLCTTIIESGLDIPNVNTIIVYDADKLGLSQLYQLRGRVGRSNRLAYAYLTYQKDKVLTETAEKRLKAIKEFTEFGSGYKIAMRDLEIRGAGNLLGKEQHGHMEAIGYDLYTKLLDETVKQLTGEPLEGKIEASIELNIESYIPSSYIENENQKIEIYKKVAAIDSKEYLYDIEEEIEDRFGDIPLNLINLLNISYIKHLASTIGIISVSRKSHGILFKLKNGKDLNAAVILEIMNVYRDKLKFNASAEPHFLLSMEDKGQGIDLSAIIKFLEKLLKIKKDSKHMTANSEGGKNCEKL